MSSVGGTQEPQPESSPSPIGSGPDRTRRLTGVALLVLGLLCVVASAAFGLLRYNDPIERLDRQAEVFARESLRETFAARGIEAEVPPAPNPDRGPLGYMVWQPTSLLAVACLVGGMTFLLTSPKRDLASRSPAEVRGLMRRGFAWVLVVGLIFLAMVMGMLSRMLSPDLPL